MPMTINEDSSTSEDDDFIVLKSKATRRRKTTSSADNNDDDDDADHAAGNAKTMQSSLSCNDESLSLQSSVPQSSLIATTSSDNKIISFKNNDMKTKSTRRRPKLQRSTSTPLQTSLRSIYSTTNQSFRILRQQSSSLVESLHSNYLPATPTGWALATLSLCSMGLQYELRLQRELTAPPLVFGQVGNRKNGVMNGRMQRLYDKLTTPREEEVVSATQSTSTNSNNKKQGIFSRKVTPSLFIGTRGVIASTAAYALGSKPDPKPQSKVRRKREVMTMAADGALIVLDWELPLDAVSNDPNTANVDIYKPNSIIKPIVLLLHGMNNDSTFGYIRSMMRTATDRGWIAVAMNLRGQDGLHKVKNSTPRGYNAGFTGDVRGVVQQLEYRLKRRGGGGNGEDEDDYVGGPIYILGYSLGANIITKYLGEESLHGTLPKCIGGGAAMGNPLHIHSGSISFPWNMLLGAGVKRSILQNATSLRQHHEPGFQHAMKKALLAPTISKLDDAAAPYLIRNDSHPPYTNRIGFKDGEEYWWESSSHRYVGHVSVPLLKISAQDDFLVFGQFRKKLNHCLENPNVVVVKTRCGGHLGWQESPPPGSGGGGGGGLLGGSGSWSDVAVADFIEALLQIREEDRAKKRRRNGGVTSTSVVSPKVRSRL